MSATNRKPPSTNDLFEEEFKLEHRNRIIAGVAILVMAAAVTFVILYYFGSMSAV